MLDSCFHQGASLHGFTPEAHLRVLAVTSQESGADSTLETLWQVCASLQKLGYPVMVIDGTASETEASPGLQQLLQQAPWHEGACLDMGSATASLAVLPAARGLPRLIRLADAAGADPLQGLLPYFRAYGLLVLYAAADTLGPLLTYTATMPLVLMPGGAAGVLASYQSVKQVVLHTGLRCTVAALLQDDSVLGRKKAAQALRSLQQCADRHLGGLLRTTTVAAHSPQDIQRLALQLLENAGTIGGSPTALPALPLTGMPAHFVRSH